MQNLKQGLTKLFSMIVFAVLFFLVSGLFTLLGARDPEMIGTIQVIAVAIGAVAGNGVAKWLIDTFKIGQE
jgi:hypothetical protein